MAISVETLVLAKKAIKEVIDDENASENSTFSSEKIMELISNIPTSGGNTTSAIQTSVTVTRQEGN